MNTTNGTALTATADAAPVASHEHKTALQQTTLALLQASEISYNHDAVNERLPMDLGTDHGNRDFYKAFIEHSGVENAYKTTLGYTKPQNPGENCRVFDMDKFENNLMSQVENRAERDAIREHVYGLNVAELHNPVREALQMQAFFDDVLGPGAIAVIGPGYSWITGRNQKQEHLQQVANLHGRISQSIDSARDYFQDQSKIEALVNSVLIDHQDLPEAFQFRLRYAAYRQAGILDKDEEIEHSPRAARQVAKDNDPDQPGGFDDSFRNAELVARAAERVDQDLES